MYRLTHKSSMSPSPLTSSPMTGLNFPVQSGSSPSSPFLNKVINAKYLENKYQKMMRSHRKLLKQQQDFCRDLHRWGEILPLRGADVIRLIACALEEQQKIELNLLDKREEIERQLHAVELREKRFTALQSQKNRIFKKLLQTKKKSYSLETNTYNSSTANVSSSLTIEKENLEQIEKSLEVVEEQLLRSVIVDLHSSFRELFIAFNTCQQSQNGSFSHLTENMNSSDSIQNSIQNNRFNDQDNINYNINHNDSENDANYIKLNDTNSYSSTGDRRSIKPINPSPSIFNTTNTQVQKSAITGLIRPRSMSAIYNSNKYDETNSQMVWDDNINVI